MFKKMDIIFSVSSYIKKLLIKLGVDERRIFIINVGVDYLLVRKVAAKMSLDKKFDACFLGSIIPRKGVIDLIKAWKIVTTKRPNAKLLIIGKGNGLYYDKVKSLVKNYNLQENVTFSGFVPEEEKYNLLSQSKIFVFPSYLESGPIAICEAISCGTPVIAYELPHYKERYKDAIVYIEKGAIKELAINILNLLEDEQIMERLRKACVELSKNFNWNSIAKYELRIIRKYLFGL
ncbi:MAG: glycosyltransferase family 4 protein [Conexivisphaerales archaeon]